MKIENEKELLVGIKILRTLINMQPDKEELEKMTSAINDGYEFVHTLRSKYGDAITGIVMALVTMEEKAGFIKDNNEN